MTGIEFVQWMEDRGWTVAGLARVTGASERTIWRWRSGNGAGMPAVWDRALRALRKRPARRKVVG